jgi:ATP-independent RNA helicase DbpA
MPKEIGKLAAELLRNPVRVSVTPAATTVERVRQHVYLVDAKAKRSLLVELFANPELTRTIVFTRTKRGADKVARHLEAAGISNAAIHGNKSQGQRQAALAAFKASRIRALVATDVAARGIDIERLDLVVNYDLPSQPEVYVHRIGRTGRAGRVGLAVSLQTTREGFRREAIEELTGQRMTLTERGQETTAKAEQRDAKMATLRISGGRKEKVRPGDILGALTGEAGGLDAKDVGKIEIHDHFSYVAVSLGVSRAAHKSLSEGRIKGRRFQITFED